ncbi:MAG: peptidoglycan DD-metalloendopeptidase family protein [Methylococcales bacterium]|nr:peptidoglycan DD-metalloendopeptidase family protein [Methylococcales bacterium]MBT7409747.1 peptidoglycan DD-metalloendopeptidase family protein [Methylococcales bacterium]
MNAHQLFFIIVFIFLSQFCFASDADLNKKSAHLVKLKQQIALLEKSLHLKKTSYDKKINLLRSIELDLAKVSNKLNKTKQNITQKNTALRILGKKLVKRNNKIKQLTTNIQKQIKAAYIMGSKSHLKLILSQQNPTKIQRLLRYYDYFYKNRIKQINSFNQEIKHLSTIKSNIQIEKNRLKIFKNKISKQKNKLLKLKLKQQSTVKSLRNDLKNKINRLKELQINEKHLNQLIQTIQQTMTNIINEKNEDISFAKAKGHMKCPLKGKVIARYNEAKIAGNLKWDGMMISAKEGTKVKALYNGQIVYASWLRGFGLLLIIDHGNNYMSLYGHNSVLEKEAGEWVSAGEIISNIGKTGGKETNVLYFAIRHNGKPKNPEHWCKIH